MFGLLIRSKLHKHLQCFHFKCDVKKILNMLSEALILLMFFASAKTDVIQPPRIL
jgi:hypothetical protein